MSNPRMGAIALLFSLLTIAPFVARGADFQFSGTSGLKFSGECENSIGQKFKMSGAVPALHTINSRRPLKICKFSKAVTNSMLRISVNSSLSDGANTYESREHGMFEIPTHLKGMEVTLNLSERNQQNQMRPLGTTGEFK